MESYKIENLSFTYPERDKKALSDINITVQRGEFVTLCGKSGCGKTTLLRLLKPAIAPYGKIDGKILFDGKNVTEYDSRLQASEIGFVMQSPDNQIVTDKVWHELAFGLESLGYTTPEIRARVAEMASFFGIGAWFHKKVTELSGGQKQLLNLASVMVMQPSVLILDEPTSQLDPIAAHEFLQMLQKINRELGITVILSEHRLEEAFPISDRIIVMENGKVIADGTPICVGEILKEQCNDMLLALPVPMRVASAVDNSFPLQVRDGRAWLEKYCRENSVDASLIPKAQSKAEDGEAVIELKDTWFRYSKELPDVIKGLSLKIRKGELFAILGGNGAGKTTALSLMCGMSTPYRGEVFINGERLSKNSNLCGSVIAVLPQNPQALFVKKTVRLDLMEILSEEKLSQEEKLHRVEMMARLCHIEALLESHPYDLSGGEQQRAALAKVLLQSPEILMLDEPTKGMDAHFKELFADILNNLKANGVTVVMVSHDIEFCAKYADRCALFFDGSVASADVPRAFFSGKSFYTTAANTMARTTMPEAVLADDIILACGKKIPPKAHDGEKRITLPEKKKKPDVKRKEKKLTPWRIFYGCMFMLIATFAVLFKDTLDWWSGLFTVITTVTVAGAVICFFPQRDFDIKTVQPPRGSRKLSRRTVMTTILVLIIVPLTIYFGWFYLSDRKYYFISLLVIAETLIPFCMLFENRKPEARELIVISVMCAIAVAGRSAFYMIPQFKPVIALIIISGVCFGGEAGFLIGAVTGFVSNFFFGQGPWTPWQMFSFGIIGFISGILFRKGLLRKNKLSLSVFGGLATVIIYGGIMNPVSVLLHPGNPTMEMLLASYALGLPMDLIHGASTVFFLWFIAEAMIEKLDRVKTKYGLIER